jgi:hypothetical protein
MSWYLRSLAPGDVHRGVFDHGSVRAVCGVEFLPLRVSGQAALLRAAGARAGLSGVYGAGERSGRGDPRDVLAALGRGGGHRVGGARAW